MTGVLELDGVRYDVVPQPIDPPPPPPPPPPPVGGSIPAGTTGVAIGDARLRLDAIDPTPASNPAGASYAGFRGPGQLVAYTQGSVTVTSLWGVEVQVAADGTVLGINDRLTTRKMTGTPIPVGGVVLSGHDANAAALKAAAKVGAKVTWGTYTPPPPPPPPPPAAGDTWTVAEYLMDGHGGVPSLAGGCNQVRVAFIRLANGELGAVEWGGETPQQTQDRLGVWVQQPGSGGLQRRVLLSFGGQDGGTSLGDTARFAAGYARLAKLYHATGLDLDLEGGALDIQSAVAVVKACAATTTGTFVVSFVPSGGPPVARYLEAARQVLALGLPNVVVQFGQQLYDAVVTKRQAIEQTRLAVGVLGQQQVLVGIMIGPDDNHWTVEEAVDIVKGVLSEFPNLGGVYFWEATQPGTPEAVTRMADRAALLAG
jgi:hypothetical protein